MGVETFVDVMQARSRQAVLICSRPDATAVAAAAAAVASAEAAWMMGSAPLRAAVVRQQLFFPDRRLIQYDCGKLQVRLTLANSIEASLRSEGGFLQIR